MERAARGPARLAVSRADAQPRRRRAVYLRTMVVFAVAVGARRVWKGNPVLLPSPLAACGGGRGSSRADLELFEHAAISLGRMVGSLAHRRRARDSARLADGAEPRARRARRPDGRAAAADLRHRVDPARAVHLRHRQRAAGLHHDLRGVLPDPARHDRRRARGRPAPGRRGAHDGRPASHASSRTSSLPAALPALLVAMRLGVATSWTAVVAAELIGAPSGLGYAIEWYRGLLMTPKVMAFIAMIGVLGYLCDARLRWLDAAAARRGRRDGGATHDRASRRAIARAALGALLPLALHRDLAGVAARRSRIRAHAAADARSSNARRDDRRAATCRAAIAAKPRPRVRRLRGRRAARDSARPRDGHARAPSSATSTRWSRASGRSPRSRSCRSRSCGSAPARRRRVIIVAYAAFFPIVINTIAGVKRVDPTLLRRRRDDGADRDARRCAPSSFPARCRRSASACASRSASRGRRSSPPSSPSAPRPAAAAPAASAR